MNTTPVIGARISTLISVSDTFGSIREYGHVIGTTTKSVTVKQVHNLLGREYEVVYRLRKDGNFVSKNGNAITWN